MPEAAGVHFSDHERHQIDVASELRMKSSGTKKARDLGWYDFLERGAGREAGTDTIELFYQHMWTP